MREPELYLEKPLPSSDDSERVVLGAIIIDNGHISSAEEKLRPEDFYSPLNRRVYGAMLTLSSQQKLIDPITIGEELKKDGSLDSIGGITVITNLTFGLPHFSDIKEYIDIVKDKSRLRQIVRANNNITTEALSEEYSSEEILELAESRLYALRDDRSDDSYFEIGPLAQQSVAHVQEIAASGNVLTGISTGFPDLDSMTLGFKKKDLIILAGRPSMGKTALGLTFAQNAAIRNGANVAIFSLEMSKEQLADRMISSEAKVDSMLYSVGMLDTAKWDRVNEAKNSLSHAKIYIYDAAGIGPGYMRPRLRRLTAQKGPLDLIVVDYLQMMEDDDHKKTENRQQEVTRISRKLKGLAKEFDCPLVALSQLSRNPEGRRDHRPMMSDLRESGAIEQDADLVMFIYRDDYYNENSELVGIAEIIIGKNRNGPTGSKNLVFDKPSTSFSSLATTQF